MTRPLTAVAIAAVLVLTGCGVSDPYTGDKAPTSSTAPPPTVAAPPPVLTSPAATTVVPPAHPADPRVRTAIRYVALQGTWTGATWAASRRELAAMSVSTAAGDLSDQASRTPLEAAARTLTATNASSRALPIGVDGPLAGNRVVVITKTTATGPGRSATRADYNVVDVTLTRLRNKWFVSDFSVQP